MHTEYGMMLKKLKIFGISSVTWDFSFGLYKHNNYFLAVWHISNGHNFLLR